MVHHVVWLGARERQLTEPNSCSRPHEQLGEKAFNYKGEARGRTPFTSFYRSNTRECGLLPATAGKYVGKACSGPLTPTF